MNCIYRLAWSDRDQAPSAVAETARGRRKGNGSAVHARISAALASLSACASAIAGGAPPPNALPTAPAVVAGQASVTSRGNRMQITESTSSAIINWGSFDIGAAAGVNIVQPGASSVLLNRVLSPNASQIFGSLTANGAVFLVNAQGVLFGRGAQVDVGTLVASGLDISNQNFLSRNWSFGAGAGAQGGAVSNAGAIQVAPGGFTALIGGRVDNTGRISARLGSVALAAGHQVALDLDDAGLLRVGVTQAALDAQVRNGGAIVADGGRIVLTAKAAGDVLDSVVNNEGLLQAQGVGVRNGQVWLLAADPLVNNGATGAAANGGAVHDAAGSVATSGIIDVQGKDGIVTLAGTTVDIAGTITAAGSGGHVLADATQQTTLDAGGRIDVSGSNGSAVLWSDRATVTHGSIDGRGIGAGTGATVEVSTAGALTFDAHVALDAASSNRDGTLLLDPATLEIAAGAGLATANTVYQNTLQQQSGNIVLSATGQITIDALAGNALNLANATGLRIASDNVGGIRFLDNASGQPSAIITHGAPVTLAASGSGSIDNVGNVATSGGNIDLSGVYVHLAGGLDASYGAGAPGNVVIRVFGGGLLTSSASPIIGGQVTLDATYGYVGTALAPLLTKTSNLSVLTGGNAYVSDTGALAALSLASRHLEGTPVGIDITASNLNLTGADGAGNGSTYATAVRWTQYSANVPGAATGPASLTISEDGNLIPGNINLPVTTVNLSTSQGYIIGGNAQPVVAAALNMSAPLGIGGTDFNGVNAETDGANPGAAGGNALLVRAGAVHADVLNIAGSINGIANISEQGNLVGGIKAAAALVQATGSIGAAGQHFTLDVGNTGEAYNLGAGTDAYVDIAYTTGLTVANLQAGGNLLVNANSRTNANGAVFQQITAGGSATLVGTDNPTLVVQSITSTNGSIAVTGNENLEVQAATLNGTQSAVRSITLDAATGWLIYGALSTNGPIDSTAAAAPLGSITLNAPQSYILDLPAVGLPGTAELRSGTALLTAPGGLGIANTAVDTATAITMHTGLAGASDGINATFRGIDSTSDPAGALPHDIHIVDSSNISGNTWIANFNGNLRVGQVNSYWSNGTAVSSGQSLSLYASGSIVPDGSVGGGAINAGDWSGNISLYAGGSLGQRGTGAGALTAAGFLQINGTNNSMSLTTGGDLFVRNTLNQGQATYPESVGISTNYASAATPYFYHFVSGSAANVAAGTPTIAFDGASTGGLLTLTGGSVDNAGNSFGFTGDGNLRIAGFSVGNSANVTFAAQNITVDPQSGANATFTLGNSSNLNVTATAGIDMASVAAGASNVTLNAQNGNLTVDKLDAPTANVAILDAGGDILGAAGNRILAANLYLQNSSGAIGADPALGGSVALAVGVSNQININNSGASSASGGGSINVLTLNDPASLALTLASSAAPGYAAHFRLAPQGTGLGFTGFADTTGITLQTLGTTGANPTAVPVSLTVNTPRIDIASGSGAQSGIGYDLYFVGSNPSVATNLSGSTGQLVKVHADSDNSLGSLTGNLALTHLSIITNTLSGGPLSINYTLAHTLSVLDITRYSWNGNDLASYPGNTIALAGSGQSVNVVESTGTGGAPGSVQFDATSASTLALNFQFNQAGTVNLGNVTLGGSSALTINAVSNGVYGTIGSAITVTPGDTVSANTVNLTANSDQPGMAALGTPADPLALDATNVTLATTGNIYATTSNALRSLAIVSSHPNWATTGASGDVTYAISGPALTLDLQDTGFQQTALNTLSASVPLDFSLTTDASITVGNVNLGPGGTVNLAANVPYVTSITNTTANQTGIFQGSGSGITAGTVNLTATGYQGNIGGATALDLATPNLGLSFNASLNVADSSALNSLALTVGHVGIAVTGQLPINTYTLAAPNIAFTLTDASSYNWNSNIDLVNLVSNSLSSFSLTSTWGSIILGNFNGADYSAGQINLGSNGSVSITSSGNIWASQGNANYIGDQAGAPVPGTAAAVVAGSLALNAVGVVANYPGASVAQSTGQAEQESIPVEVNNLSTSGYATYVTNIGSVDIVSANTQIGFFRVVEAAPGVAASITSTGTPLVGSSSMSLVAYYGSIGQGSGAPVVVNSPYLDVESGADIAVHDSGALSTLTITSNHDKAAINDTTNGGLNAIHISDSGSGAMQLGATDLGVAGGGYQITGMNAPALTSLSFTSDTSISLGSIAVGSPPAGDGPLPPNPGSVSITSTGGSILQIAGNNGQVSAQNVTLTAATTGASVGLPGAPVRVDAPGLTVNTGGNMVLADSADITSFALTIGAVTDAGGTPRYTLDNSAAPHPISMSLTGDIANNVLDINNLTVTRADAPVSIGFSVNGSSVGLGTIADAAAAGGTINIASAVGNVFGLGGVTSATNVNLSAGGSVGDNTTGAAAPVDIAGQSVSVTSNGDLRLVSPGSIDSLILLQGNGGLTAGTWSVSATGFTLAGHVVNNSGLGTLDLTAVQGSATNLSLTSYTPLALGTLAMGNGTLALSANNNTIDSDGSNGAAPNITSNAAVSLYSAYGIGDTAQITTNIAGVLNANTILGPISVNQITATPLNIGSLGIQYWWVGNTPVTVDAAGTVNFTQNFSGGTGANSVLTIDAGGDANLVGALYMGYAPVVITAGGSITSTNIFNATSVNLTAGGTMTVGNVDPMANGQGAASGAIVLQASGDINIGGQIDSSAGVAITSTRGSIFSQASDVFEQTPDLTLSAAGDIGSGSSASLGALSLNGAYCYNPIACGGTTPLTLNVQAGGRVNLAAASTVAAASLFAGGDLNLQVSGDPYENVNADILVGHIRSTGGSVTLGTAQGNIAAANGGGMVRAATAIDITAGQSAAWVSTAILNANVYGIGGGGTPLVLSAANVSLTANGNTTAQVPTTGLTDLSVGRSVVSVGGVATAGNLGTWMSGGAVTITDGTGNTVLAINDGGWAPGGSSVVNANYGSALNLSYTSYDAIILGNVNLAGGNLSLGVYNPSNISITSQGGLIQASNFRFNLNDTSGTGAASGGFGTAANPIHTQITALSGTTVGANAGVFIDQTGPITFTSLVTGGDIAITTTPGGVGTSGAVYIGNVTSNGGSVSINAAGPIGEAAGITAPSITASGAAGDGGVTLQAAGAINLGATAITSASAAVSVTTSAGTITYDNILAAAAVNLTSAASVSGQATTSQAGNIDITAQAGDIGFASVVATAGTVTFNASGNILGTAPGQNLTGLADGITASGTVTLTAGNALGSAGVPLAIDQTGGGTIHLSSGAGFDTHAVVGAAGTAGSATLEVSSGGTLDLANYYPSVLLDNVNSVGNLTFTQLSSHAEVLLNQVGASGPGAMATFDVPYGDISANTGSSQLVASRVVLNALGDVTGGTIGTVNAVDVNANVLLAVSSGNITLDSLSSGTTKAPLVASTGVTPTIAITAGGDLLLGEIVAGQQGTVNVTSTANIYDDQDSTTRVLAGAINLQAAGAIGTAADPVQTTAQTLDGSGAAQPGSINAATTAPGSIELDQQGDAVFGSLTTANGAINVLVHDQAGGLTTLTLANAAATDAAGNNINLTVSNGNLAVDQAIAGLQNGSVTLDTPQGSVIGIAQANCCVTPNVVGSVVNVTALQNVGQITNFAGFTGTPLAIEAGQSTVSSTAAGAQVFLQYYGDAVVGSLGSLQVNATGTGDQVIVAACGNLSLAGLSLSNASLGLIALAGSVLDGVGGGSSAGTPSATAASVNVVASGSIGSAADALWLNTGTITANAAGGGAWISSAGSAPVTATSVTASGGPVMVTAQGDLLVDSVNAGAGTATVASLGGSVLDGTGGDANAGAANVTGSTVTVSAAVNGGAAVDPLWVNAGVINAAATSGGVWINSAASNPVSAGTVTTGGGPVVLTSQGDLLVGSINAGSGAVNLASVTGSVLDGTGGTANAATPNITGGALTLASAGNVGASADALWVNTGTISANAATGGAWINSAASTPVTLNHVATGGGPVVIEGQGNILVDSVNARSGAVTLSSAAGAILDGTGGGANAATPNITGSTVMLSSAGNTGAAADALWLDTSVITASSSAGGIWINSGAITPVLASSVTTAGGPVVLKAQGDLLVNSVNAGSGAVTLASAGGSVLDGTNGSANAAAPDVVAGTFTSNAHADTGNAAMPLWVSAQVINASSATGGVWIDSAASTPVTAGSVTTAGGPVVLNAQGNLRVDAINAGSGTVTLASVAGSVQEGTGGAANAATPNITGSSLTLAAANDIGAAGDALWVNTTALAAGATTGGVWINSAASAPVTAANVTTAGGPVVLSARGNLLVDSVSAGSGSVTLASTAGSVLDGTGGTAGAAAPNVTAGSFTSSAHDNSGSATTPLWVDAQVINASSAAGGVWIDSAASAPVTIGSVTTANGPVVINGQGDLLVRSVNADLGTVTLVSDTGSLLDGTGGTVSVASPNVTAGTFNGSAHGSVGKTGALLWVDADVINAASATDGVWIKSIDATPVTIGAVSTATGGPVVITGAGDLVVTRIDAGSGTVSLTSTGGAILDGIATGSNQKHPNVTARSTSFSAATTVGVITDPFWVEPDHYTVTAPAGHWIDVEPGSLTPYPSLPPVKGVSPTTVFSANAQSQITPPQDLPMTAVGHPLRLAPPIEVDTLAFGLALPQGDATIARQQDATMGTASAPIEGGNEDELGRKKLTLKKKSEGDLVKDRTQP